MILLANGQNLFLLETASFFFKKCLEKIIHTEGRSHGIRDAEALPSTVSAYQGFQGFDFFIFCLSIS